MAKKKNELSYHISLIRIHHENVRWSNVIINSPISYNLLERRAMYFLTGEVKHKFVEKGLGVPKNWKELYFYLTDDDLGIIGGAKNVPRTYEVLSLMGEKFFPIRYITEEGKEIIGKVHWVDTFFFDQETGQYTVRISPEIMPYLINLNKDFTYFDVGTAMKLRSKYTQKMYELCCRYSGDYRHINLKELANGNQYKKRVIPINMNDFRKLFNLDEQRDPKTGKIIQPSIYENYKDIRRSILDVAQDELLSMYKCNASNVWFDYEASGKQGRGGRVANIIIYIYTREHPKQGELRPWRKGDEPLIPFEEETENIKKKTPAQRLHSNDYYNSEVQEQIVHTLLSRYLSKREVAYYMAKIRRQAKRFKDSYVQVIQVIQEKEQQNKFIKGTRQYKRNNIMDFVLKENLKDYGWSITPPSARKERKTETDLFSKKNESGLPIKANHI